MAARPTRMSNRALAACAIAVALALAGCGGSSSKTGTASNSSSTAEPPMQASGEPGVVASGIPFAANLTFDQSGGLWVAAATLGKGGSQGLWYVPSGGKPLHVVSGLTSPVGMAWVENRLYVASTAEAGKGQISVFEGFTGSAFTHQHVLIRGLPIGKHLIGSIAQGHEGRLFVGLGAPQDKGGPPGGVDSFSPSGGPTLAEATGLRTAFGLAFWGRQLLVSDNGPDYVEEAPDTLHGFEPAGPLVNFGFPKCYGQGGSACSGFPAPLKTFPSHATPEGVAVKGNVAFVAMYGSFPFSVKPGQTAPPEQPSEIVRIDLHTGSSNVFWHSPVDHDLLGLAIGPDGDLYATLFGSGKVVRFPL